MLHYKFNVAERQSCTEGKEFPGKAESSQSRNNKIRLRRIGFCKHRHLKNPLAELARIFRTNLEIG